MSGINIFSRVSGTEIRTAGTRIGMRSYVKATRSGSINRLRGKKSRKHRFRVTSMRRVGRNAGHFIKFLHDFLISWGILSACRERYEQLLFLVRESEPIALRDCSKTLCDPSPPRSLFRSPSSKKHLSRDIQGECKQPTNLRFRLSQAR